MNKRRARLVALVLAAAPLAGGWWLVTPRSTGLQVSAHRDRGFAIGWSVALP